ncbi:nucleotide-binding universal stress UspA family protein [Prauserella shujinwangii]|uniref:Nucleotide-binding universal stress UspA family protein n=1 Tax=Prauserella shujinwangii TaxID=1453103 RepID=A0A2T0LPW8_9PSEU|nr:universal stress protein [Prauserella shujinwangii]PRX45206.1 nucleotide-binding universal stress UspA family protein [Prauserella shujinwangii]
MTTTGNAPILVGVDGSDSALRATAWAALAAARRHAPLLLVATLPGPAPYGAGVGIPDRFFVDLETEGRRRLAEAAETAKQAGGETATLEIRTEFHIGGPIPVLRERAREARLLVLGTRGLGELTGTFVGSVAVALVAHAPCPVTVVRGRTPGAEPPREGPVVVGVDGSPLSAAALGAAFEEAALRRTRLVAVHAWSDAALSASAGFSPGELPWAEIETAEQVVLAERLAGWRERYPDVPVDRIVTRDRPVRSLLHEAEHAQLLVVGSRGRGGFSGLLLGSTSNALVHSAPCPLLIVRPGAG